MIQSIEQVNVLDLVCRGMIGKSLPLLVLQVIHDFVNQKDEAYGDRRKRRKMIRDELIDDLWNDRGSKYYRKYASGKIVTNIRLKRAFRYGR
tara:strand:+ start:5676 stop:5951 length:276 start_codon:yes stop_codon:yes gene_type:complete